MVATMQQFNLYLSFALYVDFRFDFCGVGVFRQNRIQNFRNKIVNLFGREADKVFNVYDFRQFVFRRRLRFFPEGRFLSLRFSRFYPLPCCERGFFRAIPDGFRPLLRIP